LHNISHPEVRSEAKPRRTHKADASKRKRAAEAAL
jgi:hypothetical protein